MDEYFRQELLKKYQSAGRIRFIGFTILLFFLLLMKAIGGYSYLNTALVSLIFVEAVLNQPYGFLLRRVNLYRFQFYQMTTDIIVISWVLYYMGGIEAPLVSIAYYMVILWAGVVSGAAAVFFAVLASALMFSAVVLLGYFEILPPISYFRVKMPIGQMFSLLLGNVSFLFAFGYFSMHSSQVAKLLERRKQEESLRHTHKFLAAGYLVAGIAHDIVNHLVSIRAYVNVLLQQQAEGSSGVIQAKNDRFLPAGILTRIEEAEKSSTALLSKLIQFSQHPKEEFRPTDLNAVIDEALGLTAPLVKMANIKVQRVSDSRLPFVMVVADQIQEVFVALILNAVDAITSKGTIIVKTSYTQGDEVVRVWVGDTGKGIKQEDLPRITEPFFTTKGSEGEFGLGLTIAYEIVARHKGTIDVTSTSDEGTVFEIALPVAKPQDEKPQLPPVPLPGATDA